MIKQIDVQDPAQEPLVDDYGRVTFFYVELGDQKLPIYQPGSVMFESSVKPDTDSAVVAGGSQQNGAILGNGCAIFLAKFLTKLVLKYNELSACNGHDSKRPINKAIYKVSLETILLDLSLEDMREHGRLLALKEKLVGLVDEQDPLSVNTLSLFQLKDLRCPNIDPKSMDDVTQDQVLKGMDARQ